MDTLTHRVRSISMIAMFAENYQCFTAKKLIKILDIYEKCLLVGMMYGIFSSCGNHHGTQIGLDCALLELGPVASNN